MIEIKNLTEKDKGRWVKYQMMPKGKIEYGRIKSWRVGLIFVVYFAANDWDRYEEYTAQSTQPRCLEFADDYCFRCGGSGEISNDVYNEDSHNYEPTGTAPCPDCKNNKKRN